MLNYARNSYSFLRIASLSLCLFGYSYNTLPQNLDSLVSSLNDLSLPIVHLEFDKDSINRLSYTSGIITIHNLINKGGGNSYYCKIRIRGQSSAYYDKKCYAVKLVDADGNDLDENVFGIREENSWILDAMANDRLRMRNRLCFDVWNEMSQLPYDTKYDRRNGTKGRFVEVFVNKEYRGIYCMSDKIDRKLLGLKKLQKNGSENTVRGVLYKGVKWGLHTLLQNMTKRELIRPYGIHGN